MSWTSGLFDCFDPIGTCCLAAWCPCVQYGKTRARSKNPSDMDPSGCNGDCAAWCALQCISAGPLLQCMNRGQLRNKHNIDGNACTDCLISYCCNWCALVQEDKEVKVKEQGGNPAATGYQKQDGMMYTQQTGPGGL